MFAQNEKATAQLLTEHQTTVKQNNATTAQSQREMMEAFAHIFAENKEALGQQRQMSIEEYKALKERTNETIAQALSEQQAALEQQKQMSDQQRQMNLEEYKALKERTEEEMAQIIGAFGKKEIASLTAQLEREKATLDSKNGLIVTGHEQNKKKRRFLIGSGVAASVTLLPSIIKGMASYFTMSHGIDGDQRDRCINAFFYAATLSKIGATIAMASLIYGAYLPHRDTESLEADAQLAKGTIKELKELLEASQTKTPCPQVDEGSPETPATPEEVPGVITEEPEVPADKDEAPDFEPVED